MLDAVFMRVRDCVRVSAGTSGPCYSMLHLVALYIVTLLCYSCLDLEHNISASEQNIYILTVYGAWASL